MAGPNKSLLLDPGLQKYYGTIAPPQPITCAEDMDSYVAVLDPIKFTANRWKYFKWTPRNAWLSVVYMALIPGTLAYIGYKTDGKYDFRGKRRGDTIAEW
ncbi:hypothetical protein PHISCL_04931 [Aspergillus sclerotialis]|uniref:Complex I-B15 n=1 Tax=Aspergillus sclerotialis TaxID=2070753 RepID=A0A3A2ZXI7_9EURO|nr:hypothetical protein PHISCL_04931 [Aspergillus sclerotialis]